MSKNLEAYIDILKENDAAVLFENPIDRDIDYANGMLQEHKFAGIPEGYINFIKQTDGLMCNGIELYGINEHHREKDSYTFPNLKSVHDKYIDNQFFKNKLVIGSLPEKYIVYNAFQTEYEIILKFDFTNLYYFKSFNEVLEYLLS